MKRRKHMTVGQLIAELQKQPAHLRVQIVYDSAVCSEDIVLVSQWFPNASLGDNKGRNVVGLFDEGSSWERSDPEDCRWPQRPTPQPGEEPK